MFVCCPVISALSGDQDYPLWGVHVPRGKQTNKERKASVR